LKTAHWRVISAAFLLCIFSFLLPVTSLALSEGRSGQLLHRRTVEPAIERIRSVYEDGLASLALADWQLASDRFYVVWLSARELEARAELTESELTAVRSLAQKAEHLGLQACHTAHLLRHTEPATEVCASDLSSYLSYDSGPRLAPQLPSVEPEMNQKVRKWMDFYHKEGSKTFSKWLGRSRQYLGMVKAILASEGVPTDLAYLILVESGFNLRARSWKHAVGPWQFILGTARLFGLRVDPWIDERCDPERSTVAAARYLRKLYSEFESWPLALAAYNTGEGRVRRALKKQNTRDFWSLRLPRQTREYVPQYMAALHIVREPEKYGFDGELPAPLTFEEVMVFGPVDLREIASVCESSVDAVRLLNPAFRRYNSPARKGGTKVRVPSGKAPSYIAALALEDIRAERIDAGAASLASDGRTPGALSTQHSDVTRSSTSRFYDYEYPPVEDELYLSYRVKKGDCLYTIARNFGVSITSIQEFNEIGRRNIIKPGQKLLIPREDVKLSSQRSRKGGGRSAKIVHVVRTGDTLYSISRSYGVSIKDIARWNALRNPRLIRPGQKLTILPN
jgi:membrane-bound lytic murein transglycosylase D